MRTYLYAILWLVLSGCSSSSDENNSDSLKFIPANGWILVKNGSVSEIKEAILDYDKIAKEEVLGVFKVELHQQKNGTIAVHFPNGLPSYDMANLTVWLNAPPGQAGVDGALSWLTTPDGSAKYNLKPEVENNFGDTLIGVSESGQSIRVYVPDTGIKIVVGQFLYESEPRIEISNNPIRFTVTLDTNTSWGNPMFIVNKQKNVQ